MLNIVPGSRPTLARIIVWMAGGNQIPYVQPSAVDRPFNFPGLCLLSRCLCCRYCRAVSHFLARRGYALADGGRLRREKAISGVKFLIRFGTKPRFGHPPSLESGMI